MRYDRHADRAFTLMSGLWGYITEFEYSDERVAAAAVPDLLDLKVRIDRLVAKVSSKAA